MLDLLEHIEYEVAFLKTIMGNSLFHRDTLFLLTVPAFNNLFSNHDRFLNHYRRYTLNGLFHIVNQAGHVSIIRSGHFFLIPLIYRMIQVLIERYLSRFHQHNGTLVEWQFGDRITNIVHNSLLKDFEFAQFFEKLKIRLPGLSCYLVFKKRFY